MLIAPVYAFGLYNYSVRSLLPPLKIHTWGGLGSQLYAVALAQDLRARFPHRRLQVVLHTGGVTRRVPEIVELFPTIEYRFQDDFQSPNYSESGEKKSSGGGSKELLKNILIRLHFVTLCNNDLETRSVRFWTMCARGHYSYRSIGDRFLFMLWDSLAMGELSEDYSSACSVHYRLGDLLSLEEKSPISEEDIKTEYFRINQKWNFTSTFVFSDSPIEAKLRFSKFVSCELHAPDITTRQVMVNAIQSAYFIGTASKISFWIASIRAICFAGQSSLPKKNFSQYIGLLQKRISHVFPYETGQK